MRLLRHVRSGARRRLLAGMVVVATAAGIGTMISPASAAQPTYGPYPAKVAIDGRASMRSSDRVKTDAYLVGAAVNVVCQDAGEAVNGSSIWDYTREGYWVPDTYVKTGTDGYVSGIPRCLSLGIDGHANQGSATGYGPYPVKVDLDGRGSADPNDRVRTDAYLAGSPVFLKCQDQGVAYNGSSIWDYTSDGLWIPDSYVTTGTDGYVSGVPRCSSIGVPTNVSGNTNGGLSFPAKTTLNGYQTKSLSADRIVDKYREGSYITVMCQAYGEPNYGGSNIWDKTSDGLWVADYYVKTGSTGIVMRRCDNDAGSGTGVGGNRFLAKTTLNGYRSKSLSASRVDDKYPSGTYITVACQAYGEYNYGGSAIWDRTSDGLWVADYYVKTGSSGFVMGRCDNDPPSGATTGPGITTPGDPASGSVSADATRQRIIQAAWSQVGVEEYGDNCNPYGRNGMVCGYAWCAMFASWAWRQGGVDVYLPAVQSFYNWGKNRGLLRTPTTARPGDLILYDTGQSISHHIGVIVDVRPDGKIVTIEGNTGDAVRRVGPFDPARPGSAGTYSGEYAIVSPVNDTPSTKIWQGSEDVNLDDVATCAAWNEYAADRLDFRLCLVNTPGSISTWAIFEIRARITVAVQAKMTIRRGDGVTTTLNCPANLMAAAEVRRCESDFVPIKVGPTGVAGNVRVGNGGWLLTMKAGGEAVQSEQQTQGNWCGPAAIRGTLHSMGGAPPSQASLASEANTTNLGTSPNDMARVLNAHLPSGHGYHQYAGRSFDAGGISEMQGLDWIRAGIDLGQPSIVVVRSASLSWLSDTGGLYRHYLVVYGYGTEDNNDANWPFTPNMFKVMDPLSGNIHTMTAEELVTAGGEAAFPGDVLLVTPL